MDRGKILEWYVKPGDELQPGSVVALVSTDKADIDVEIWQPGTVTELLLAVGDDVPVGTPMLRLDGRAPAPEPVVTAPVVDTATAVAEVAASPQARALAAERGIDLRSITGTGPRGAILARDLDVGEAREDVAGAVVEPTPSVGERRTGMRAAIAERMSTSNRDIPHYYLEHDIDLRPALDWLEAANADLPVPERILSVALLLKAVALAITDVPDLNGYWVDDGFEPATSIDLAVVVALRGGGLVTPKIAGVDQRSLAEIMESLNTIVAGARRGALRSSWMSGAGLTVSNLGDRGVDRVSGVIFPPQVALVGFGGVRQRPWVVDGEVVARPVVTASLAADHRATDGVIGSRFLANVANYLRTPEEL